jgi:dihydroflavonol-4-reductase
MKALVTGSTGFVGSALCRGLLEQGITVRAFHRPTSLPRLLEGLDVEHFEGNLTQPQTVQAAMQGVDVVFHAAAHFGRRDEPGQMYMVIVEGTRAVAQAALEAGVKRLVYTSSVAALGIPEEAPLPGFAPVLLDERHAWNYHPQDWHYGYAKYLAELEVQKAVVSGLDAVIVNPTLVFGAGDIYRRSSSIVVQAANGRLPAMVEGGLNVVHIKDVIAGHLAALQRGRRGERYILGGENMTIVNMIETAARIAGTTPPKLILPNWLVQKMSSPMRILQPFLNFPIGGNLLKMAGRYFYYDVGKATLQLGLGAPLPAQAALQDAFDWFVSVGAISK